MRNIRCINCGEICPEEATYCNRCGRPLEKISQISSPTPAGPSGWQSRETRMFGAAPEAVEGKKECPNCSYPVMDGCTVCPNCGYDFAPAPAPQNIPASGRATVRDVDFGAQNTAWQSRKTMLDSAVCSALEAPVLVEDNMSEVNGSEPVLYRGECIVIDGKKYIIR